MATRELNVSEVHMACWRYIGFIEKDRSERRERLIAEVMKPHKRFFRTVLLTRDEAIKKLNSSDIWNDWWFINYRHRDAEASVRKLMKLCDIYDPHSSTTVTITSEEADIIRPFLGKE